MNALFTSRNLIGDGLEIGPALRVWHQQHPDAVIHLLTDDNNTADIYNHMGVPLTVCFQHNELIKYDFEFNFNINKAFDICDQEKCMMAQGYAKLLGVELGPSQEDVGPFYDAEVLSEEDQKLFDSVPDGVILIAPFSRSCTSHQMGRPPNKCLPWDKWKPVIRFLRTLERPLRITGGADDRADELAFSEEEYLTGFPLRPLAKVMKEKAHLLISVDNGLSHLAGSQKIPHILFYPLCLGMHYAVPWGNPYVVPIHMDPALVDPTQVGWSVKRSYLGIQELLSKKNSPWAVICEEHGQMFLSKENYMKQLSNPDALWKCPICGVSASFDDENYAKQTEG